MTDPQGHWPLLEQIEAELVTFISEHPNMTELAAACGPFFRWMRQHDTTTVATQ